MTHLRFIRSFQPTFNIHPSLSYLTFAAILRLKSPRLNKTISIFPLPHTWWQTGKLFISLFFLFRAFVQCQLREKTPEKLVFIPPSSTTTTTTTTTLTFPTSNKSTSHLNTHTHTHTHTRTHAHTHRRKYVIITSLAVDARLGKASQIPRGYAFYSVRSYVHTYVSKKDQKSLAVIWYSLKRLSWKERYSRD